MSPEMRKRKEHLEREKRKKTDRKKFEQTALNNHLSYMGEIAIFFAIIFLIVVVLGILEKYF